MKYILFIYLLIYLLNLCFISVSFSNDQNHQSRNIILNKTQLNPHQRIQNNQQKDWTVLVYMAADNDLSPYALLDLIEMEKSDATINHKINVITQVDLTDNDQILRFNLNKKNENPIAESIPHVDSTNIEDFLINKAIQKIDEHDYEKELSAKERFSDFISWGIKSYPAKQVMVVIWGHGEGYKLTPLRSYGGVGFDESDGSFLTTKDIKEVFINIKTKKENDPAIDVTVFDACLMQSIEVASELVGVSEFLVGSVQIQDYLGLPYTEVLNDLSQNPSSYEFSLRISKLVEKELIKQTTPLRNFETFTISALNTHHLNYHFLPQFKIFAIELNKYIELNPLIKMQLQMHLKRGVSFPGQNRDIGNMLGNIEKMLKIDILSGFLIREVNDMFDPSSESTKKNKNAKKLLQRIYDLNHSLNELLLSYSFGDFYKKKNINDEEDYFLGHFKGLSIWVPKDKNEYDKRISEFKDSTFSKQVQINEKYWSELIYSF